MNATEKIRGQIVLLVHGPCSKIVSEMEGAVNEMQRFYNFFHALKEALLPSLETATGKIRITVETAKSVIIPLETFERAIDKILAIRGVQRFRELEEELSRKEAKPSKIPALRREMQSLKSSYSKELSELISKMRQVLYKRISLVQHWKSVVKVEIGFLEELLQTAVDYLLRCAAECGEENLIGFLREKLEQLRKRASEHYSSFTGPVEGISNTKVLKDSLVSQLQEVIRLEKAVAERHTILEELSRIEMDMNHQAETAERNAPSEAAPTPAAEGVRQQSPLRANRMATAEERRGR